MNKDVIKKEIELNPEEKVTIDFYKIPNTKLAKAYRLFQLGMLKASAGHLDKSAENMGVILFEGLEHKYEELKNIFFSSMACSEKGIGFFSENEEKMLDVLGFESESVLILQGVMHYLGKSLKKGGDKGKSPRKAK